jgi:hypothetical protein
LRAIKSQHIPSYKQGRKDNDEFIGRHHGKGARRSLRTEIENEVSAYIDLFKDLMDDRWRIFIEKF